MAREHTGYTEIGVTLSLDKAQEMIEQNLGAEVAQSVTQFKESERIKIAHMLIESGYARDVANAIPDFAPLDEDIARALIEQGEAAAILPHLDSFTIENWSHVVSLLMERGANDSVATNIKYLKNLDAHIATELTKRGLGESVLKARDSFVSDIDRELANSLIEHQDYKLLAENLYILKGIDAAIADTLITHGQGEHVAAHPEVFANLDYQKTADQLRAQGNTPALMLHLRKFATIDHETLAKELIASGQGDIVAVSLENMHTLHTVPPLAGRLCPGLALNLPLADYSTLDSVSLPTRPTGPFDSCALTQKNP